MARGGCTWRRIHLLAGVLLPCFLTAQSQTDDHPSMLASPDGFFYPALEDLLARGVFISTTEQLPILLRSNYDNVSRSIRVDRPIGVFGATFMTVFASVRTALWVAGNGTDARNVTVPYAFNVTANGSLALVGLDMSFDLSPANFAANSAVPAAANASALVEWFLSRYFVIGGGGKLQLLRVSAQGVPCRLLNWTHQFLRDTTARGANPELGSSLDQPMFRLVYPEFFVKRWYNDVIGFEDLVATCKGTDDYVATPCPAAEDTRYFASTFLEFLAAIIKMEDTDVDKCQYHRTVITLTQSISLDLSAWPVGGLYITSNVSIEGMPGAGTILDFSGGINLFHIRGSAYVRLVNLVLANLAPHPSSPYTCVMWAFYFSRSLTLMDEGRLHIINATGLVPPDEFLHMTYWAAIFSSPNAVVTQLGDWQRILQRMEITKTSNATDRIVLDRLCFSGITAVNFSFSAQLPPGIPNLVPMAGVSELVEFQQGPPYVIAIYTPLQLIRLLFMPDSNLSYVIQAEGLKPEGLMVTLLFRKNVTVSQALWPNRALPVQRRIAMQGAPGFNAHVNFSRGRNYIAVPQTQNTSLRLKLITLYEMGWAAEYNATTAVSGLSITAYMQTGMWALALNRSAAASATKVDILNVRLGISLQELQILQACMSSYQGDGAKRLPGSLTDNGCRELLPRESKLAYSEANTSMMFSSMQTSVFRAENLTFFVDSNVDRPDLQAMLDGTYCPPKSASGLSKSAIGIVVGCIVGGVLAALLVTGLVVRKRQQQRDAEMARLEAERQERLSELAKSNPLAQLILEHMAAGSSGSAMAGGSSNGAAGSDGSQQPQKQGQAAVQAGPLSSLDPTSKDVELLRGQRVNMAAADLAELLLALPILGPASSSRASAAPSLQGALQAAGARRQQAAAAAAAAAGTHQPHVALALAGQQGLGPPLSNGATSGGLINSWAGPGGRAVRQPLSGFAGFMQAMALRLGNAGARGAAKQTQQSSDGSSSIELTSPVLEELHRLSVDLAGEIDDNQLIVTEVVASGGFGTVYKGAWHGLPVAVKTVLFSTASVNRRIALQEAALSKSISHPNIVATYAVDAKAMTVMGRSMSGASASSIGTKQKSLADIQEWRLYIIQEFCDCGTLRRAMDRKTFHDHDTGMARMEMVLDICFGVASALAHLHAKNIVHGDLNPKNVLLKAGPYSGSVQPPAPLVAGAPPRNALLSAQQQHSAIGSSAAATPSASSGGAYPFSGKCGFQIKVADFGLSVKMAAQQTHVSNLRQGTPFYAAPEVVGEGIFSRAADAYAYGIMMWELYHGKPIWVPDPAAPGGYSQQPEFPALPPHCPLEYASLMADCLQSNHLARPEFTARRGTPAPNRQGFGAGKRSRVGPAVHCQQQ